MVNFWEETAVDRDPYDGTAQAAPAVRIVLRYEGLAEIISRLEAGPATRARVLVLAEEIEAEGVKMVALAGRIRALAAGGR